MDRKHPEVLLAAGLVLLTSKNGEYVAPVTKTTLSSASCDVVPGSELP
jgi:hypothetical protein